tara:strand:+ start:337 stop:819 length:483 start_codon:yes stop_codon:yes gene_type:complete
MTRAKTIEKIDFLALKIPADAEEKITVTTWTGDIPFQGKDGIHEQCNCRLIQIVPALFSQTYNKALSKKYSKSLLLEEGTLNLDGELYCDEEGLLTGKQRNYRASMMRKWYFDRYGAGEGVWDRNSEHAHILGDACFVVRVTDDNMKIIRSFNTLGKGGL